MAVTKETLKWRLQKEDVCGSISGEYSYSNYISTSGSDQFANTVSSIIGAYSAYLEDKCIQENEVVNDFLFLAPLYTRPENGVVSSIKYPCIMQQSYKSILLNATSRLCVKCRGRYSHPFILTYLQDGVFIGNGVILNKNMNILFAIKGDITKQGDCVLFSNPYVIIDSSIFVEKTSINTFIKNTLFPILLELGYKIEIEDLGHIDIFKHPIPPQSYDFKEEVTQVLYDNLNELCLENENY